MLTKNKNLVVTTILSAVIAFMLIYTASCSKVGPSAANCENYPCFNGGYCHVDTFLVKSVKTPEHHCICPTGYDGYNCSNVVVTKYLGTWDVLQTNIGSDSANCKGKDTTYQVLLATAGSPPTFFMNNFFGLSNYNDLVCSLDSTNSYNFVIDTLSAFHMYYDHFRLLQQGTGSISADSSTITAKIWIRHLNATTNWQNDTFTLKMTQRH